MINCESTESISRPRRLAASSSSCSCEGECTATENETDLTSGETEASWLTHKHTPGERGKVGAQLPLG